MDVSTDISIAQLTDRLLRIKIDSGQVMVNLQNQSPRHELEAIIGNTVISVRGTLFVAGVYVGGEAIIIVLDGSVYVNGVLLVAGYTMRIHDGATMSYVITPTVFTGLDSFQLNAISGNRQRLLLAGMVNHANLEEVTRLLLGEEADAIEPEEVIIAEATPEPSPTPTPITSGQIRVHPLPNSPISHASFAPGTNVTVTRTVYIEGVSWSHVSFRNALGFQVVGYVLTHHLQN